MFERIVTALEKAVSDGTCPSAAIAIGTRDEILLEGCFGVRDYDDPVPVNVHTLYDMASLTKIIGTTMVAYRFIEDGLLRLDDTLNTFFPGTLPDKREITIRQIMTHSSGMPAHYYVSFEAATPAQAAEAILAHPLSYPTGTEVEYSCMGFILLAKILEKIGGKPIDQLAQELVFDPLGMVNTTYHVQTDDVASTEYAAEVGGCLKGIVHDENARFMKGISGNAGIFSDLKDMERFAKMLLSNGELDGKRYLTEAMLHTGLKNYTPGMSENRGIGMKLGTGGFMGDLTSDSAYGHTGYTGTSLVIDPEMGIYVVLLANRVHPTRANVKFIRFRGLLHNMIFSEWSRHLSEGDK